MTALTFTVAGIPAPQGSKRVVPTGRGPRVVESSKAVGPWREAIRAECQRAVAAADGGWPRRGPVRVEAVFLLPRPKGHFGTGRNTGRLRKTAARLRPTSKPDVDKLARALLDAASGVVFADDAQVVDLAVVKSYTLPGEPAGMQVRVTDLAGGS